MNILKLDERRERLTRKKDSSKSVSEDGLKEDHFVWCLCTNCVMNLFEFLYLSETKMVLMTMIARVFDGLPLAASVQEDEQTGK